MNNTITAAFVQQFHDSFVAAAEQKESRFESKVVNRGSIVGSSFTANDMGTVEMSQVTNRYGDTEFTIPDVGTRTAAASVRSTRATQLPRPRRPSATRSTWATCPRARASARTGW